MEKTPHGADEAAHLFERASNLWQHITPDIDGYGNSNYAVVLSPDVVQATAPILAKLGVEEPTTVHVYFGVSVPDIELNNEAIGISKGFHLIIESDELSVSYGLAVSDDGSGLDFTKHSTAAFSQSIDPYPQNLEEYDPLTTHQPEKVMIGISDSVKLFLIAKRKYDNDMDGEKSFLRKLSGVILEGEMGLNTVSAEETAALHELLDTLSVSKPFSL